MKEDIFEQILDEYLMHLGYFTVHNVKFKPSKNHPEFNVKQDHVASDIDIIAINPTKSIDDQERVIVVSCKSWQEGFDHSAVLSAMINGKFYAGKEAWRGFRELWSPKWSSAFLKAVEEATGSRKFKYWLAVTRIIKEEKKDEWENYPRFVSAIEGNRIRLISFSEILDALWVRLSTTPASTDVGRMVQLIKASRWQGNLK